MSLRALTPGQKEATRPEANVWVAASAGTGKTHVLMARVLRLLLTGTEPEKILCLTYTKAAAAEMANRITERLGRWVMMKPAALAADIMAAAGEEPDEDMMARARGLFAAALDVPGGLQIDTIHAFCQALLKRFPVEASLSPHFAVLDERTANALLDEAIQEVMAAAGRDAKLGRAFAVLASECAESSVRELILSLIGLRRRIPALEEGEAGRARLIAALHQTLRTDPGAEPAAVLAAGLADGAFDGRALARLAAAAARGSAPEQEKAARWRAFLENARARARNYAGYRGTFFTQKGEPQKKVLNDATLAQDPALGVAIAAETRRLQALDDRVALCRVARRTAALITAAGAVNAVYAKKKRASGRLDYDDLILESARLLAREDAVAWVRFKLDGGIDHVLVDEAQDTNRAQWAIVKSLTEEFAVGASAREDVIRTIFAVGDVKQSIFRFQGAEPEEFAVAREHYRERSDFGQIEFLDRRLQLSFRSTEAVLAAVDAVCEHGPARAGLAGEGEDIRHGLERAGEAGRVELWEAEAPDARAEAAPGWRLPLVQRFEATAEAKLARRIAAKIESLIAGRPAGGSPVRPGDIMVLVRQRSPFIAHLIRELKTRAIPVAGADRMKLKDQIAIQDLLALGSFALLPEDDFTLACVLKGPFVGLSEEELFALCHGRRGALWDQLRRQAKKNRRLAAGVEFLAGLLREADYVTPFAFFAAILSEKGGRKRLARRLGLEINDPVDEFLSLCIAFEAANVPSLQGFLRWFGESESEIKRDLERGADEVRILTVHGAKGLQAPVVFLPDTCRKPSPRAAHLLEIASPFCPGPVPAWVGGGSMAVGPCQDARAEALRRERDEANRLLYVALTRAEDRLYIAGWRDRTGNDVPEDSWYAMIREAFAKLRGLREERDEDGRPLLVLENPGNPPRARETLRPAHEAVALPKWASTPAAPEKPRLQPIRPSGAAAGEAALPPAVKAKALKRGEAVHRLLELLPALPAKERRAAAARFLKQPAFRLAAQERAALWTRLNRVLTHRRFRALFGPGSRAEASVAGEVNGQFVAGQVDRLWVGAHEVYIADYKTNRAVPKTPSAAPQAYLKQLRLYAALLGAIYPTKKIRAALVWVEDGSLMEIPEKMLAPRGLDGGQAGA